MRFLLLAAFLIPFLPHPAEAKNCPAFEEAMSAVEKTLDDVIAIRDQR